MTTVPAPDLEQALSNLREAICRDHQIGINEFLSPRREHTLVKARRDFIRRAVLLGAADMIIAGVMNRDRSLIRHSIRVMQNKGELSRPLRPQGVINE